MADFTDLVDVPYVPETIPHSATSAGDHTNVISLSYIEGIAGGGVLPVVAYVAPAPSSTIDPADTITIDVTDVDSPTVSTFLFARFAASGGVEVVWDGFAFTPFYGTSTRVPITNGFRYTLRRSGGGWLPGGITFNANVIDDTGGIAT